LQGNEDTELAPQAGDQGFEFSAVPDNQQGFNF
jgi:hypothetical protein